jgi:hypothetical protein
MGGWMGGWVAGRVGWWMDNEPQLFKFPWTLSSSRSSLRNLPYGFWGRYMFHSRGVIIALEHYSSGACLVRLLQKLTVAHLIKKSSVFNGTRGIITAFTKACHWSVYWTCFSKIHFIIIFSSTPRPPKCSVLVLPLAFHMRFVSITRVLHAPPISFCFIGSS